MAAAMIAATVSTASMATAEVDELRLAHSYSLSQIPVYIMQDKKLIEKHAALLGIPDLKVTFNRVNSGNIANDLMLSNNVDINISGAGPLLAIWDKTSGKNKVKGMMGLTVYETFLFTVDPDIQTLDDYGPKDRIAMADVRISLQALTIRTILADKFGWDERFRLDANMLPMGNADATTQLLAGVTEIKSAVLAAPYSQTLREAGARVILSSADAFGGKITSILPYTTQHFKDDNPIVYQATINAMKEAIQFAREHREESVEIYLAHEPNKAGAEFMLEMFGPGKDVDFSENPQGIGALSQFKEKSGEMNNAPTSWKDLFFEEAWVLDGS